MFPKASALSTPPAPRILWNMRRRVLSQRFLADGTGRLFGDKDNSAIDAILTNEMPLLASLATADILVLAARIADSL